MSALLIPETPLCRIVEDLGSALLARGWRCATAESCTGGLAGAVCTAVPGASAWFAGGVISYANDVKISVLGVEAETLEAHGAVSEQVVRQMAAGLCRALGTEAGVSISGVAGPGGGSEEKPVGTVWLGFWVNGRSHAQKLALSGSREDIRSSAVRQALAALLAYIPMAGATQELP